MLRSSRKSSAGLRELTVADDWSYEMFWREYWREMLLCTRNTKNARWRSRIWASNGSTVANVECRECHRFNNIVDRGIYAGRGGSGQSLFSACYIYLPLKRCCLCLWLWWKEGVLWCSLFVDIDWTHAHPHSVNRARILLYGLRGIFESSDICLFRIMLCSITFYRCELHYIT